MLFPLLGYALLLPHLPDQTPMEQALEAIRKSPRSSLGHYQAGELFLEQNNLQSAANEFREALNGDLDPPWIRVWSHLRLAAVFTRTGQRERATNALRQALATEDNTRRFVVNERGLPRDFEVLHASDPLWSREALPFLASWEFDPPQGGLAGRRVSRSHPDLG